MKKALSILLALVLCLSLCACGGSTAETPTEKTMDKNDSANYIGVWETKDRRITINKGGVGRYEQPNSDYGYFDFTWEIKDEVLVITIREIIGDMMATFELDESGTSLTIIQDGLPGYTTEEKVYQKQ
jgi:outer membrane biogenesis lipoprotein LolB